MPDLYAATARRAAADDWTQLRPLLLVLRTMLRINTTFVARRYSSGALGVGPSGGAPLG